MAHACMCKTAVKLSICSQRYASMITTPSAPAYGRPPPRIVASAAPQSDVGRILQQHKFLMNSGFSYDQASLILKIVKHQKPSKGRCEPPRAPQPPTTTAAPDGEAPSGTHPQCATTAADTAASPPHAAAAPTAPQFPDEQLEGHQQQLSAFEQRLSFLELELLKQSISSTPLIPAAAHAIDPSFTPFDDACDDSDASPYGWDDTHHHQGHHPGRSRAQDYALAATGLGGTSWGQAPSGVGAAAAEQLDPEVLAVAELLLARQGLPLSLAVPPPDSCSAAAPSGTPPNRQPLDSTLQSARQAAACTGGAQHPGAARRRVAAAAAGMVAPSSIWGVGRHALRQQGRQQSAEGVAGSARVAGRRRAGRRYGGGAGYGVDWEGDEDMGELAPYEPNDLAAAGLIIAVYFVGLLTLFGLAVAGADSAVEATDALDMMTW